MALVMCKLCRKIFTAAGGRTCPACKKRLDDLYMKVRDFLRDNPKMEFNVDTLSTSLDADIRDVQALMDMGYKQLGGRSTATVQEHLPHSLIQHFSAFSYCNIELCPLLTRSKFF